MNTKFGKYNHIDLLRSAAALLALGFLFLSEVGWVQVYASGVSVFRHSCWLLCWSLEFIIVCGLVLFFSAGNFVTELPEKLFDVQPSLC
jgi:hypothetical protein